jgi:hypothetical protein
MFLIPSLGTRLSKSVTEAALRSTLNSNQVQFFGDGTGELSCETRQRLPRQLKTTD